MAAQKQAMQRLTVQGRVFEAGSRRGIADLLVTAYDVAADAEGHADLPAMLKGARRLGSVATGDSGAFSLGLSVSVAANAASRKAANLLVVVAAPDDEKSASAERVIYFSNPPRFAAADVETFNIGVSAETLARFALDGAAGAQANVRAYQRRRADEQELTASMAQSHKAVLLKEVEEKKTLRGELLGKITTNLAAVDGGAVVVGDTDTGTIKDKNVFVAGNAVLNANALFAKAKGVPVNLYLTEADRVRLASYLDHPVNGFARIPESALQDILFRSNSSENPGTLLVHRNPIAKFCAGQTIEEECAKLHTGILAPAPAEAGAGPVAGGDPSGSGDPPPTGTTGAQPLTELTDADIRHHALRLVSTAPSPEAASGRHRPDKAAVEKSVADFSLRKGPAETPAFYDSHSLQIAFDHVWKVLVDEQLVDSAHIIQKTYLQKTGLALSDVYSSGTWKGVLSATTLYDFLPRDVPSDVLANFDITLQEWRDLRAPHQEKLQALARTLEAGSISASVSIPRLPGLLGGQNVTVAISTRLTEKRRQELREQGERLIDSVRHDDYYTLHKTLRDLQARMNGVYEFTVFAADKDHHSVNFGLVNTYRHEWTPIEYQAGQLVKTIPLSPKEERKYSVKVTRNVKTARKEAVKNNSSLKDEQSTTSRVETEIMRKAQTKTNFGLSTDGTFDIGLAKGSAKTTFGVDAQQESSESRKDMRDAVLKAVQEYLEERTVSVETEDTDSSETVESGTIVNPNDELAVTYLFYELQRRYRVSEQLHRVRPVVMVAQKVPAPHEITEAWVVANDWIINRNLLDDSFRPALQYLANRSVGDDFALRELRKNLRQQRNLVETLRIELSIASSESNNRYKALENAINRRIDEESEENTDGLFSDIGDFFGAEGQDPEAMKARELAAKDSHQYAVEKAEKAAVALRQEMGALHGLTKEYNETLRGHLDNETRVKRLLVHLRNNIFHYMQAIWSMEPPDQRFLRLHKVQVPVLELAEIDDPRAPGTKMPDRHYHVDVTPRQDIFADFREPGTTKHKALMSGTLKPITRHKALVEVADIQDLICFFGNYMVFGMKQHNALTEFMAAPYVDAAFGAMDPDELSNVSLSDFGKYVCCLHAKLKAEGKEAQFTALKPQLRKWLELLLADPLRNGDDVIVPTSSLFIEALPAAHPLLEDFKLRHRELDVYKVQAEVRKAEMENLRLAARLVNNEREDPDIDKKIVVQGSGIVVSPDPD